MKNFYDFIRRTSGKLNEAAGQVYDWTKEKDIFFQSFYDTDGKKYYQLKTANNRGQTSPIKDIAAPDPDEIKHIPDSDKSGVFFVITRTGSKYLFDFHNLDDKDGVDGKPPISNFKLMWREIKTPPEKPAEQQQQQQQQQGAPNQQQPQLTAEQYKELVKSIMQKQGILELCMKKAIDEINNPTHPELENLADDQKKEFIELVSSAPSYRSQIARNIDKIGDNEINYFGPLIIAAVNSGNMDHMVSFCSSILMLAIHPIMEQQEKQKQQEDSQGHLLALAKQLNNPKIRKGLVYMMNGNPGRLSVWAAEIKTPQDLQAKYDDWVRRELIQ